MCGLTGYQHKKSCLSDGKTIKEMTAIQRHRGPDDQGFLTVNTHQNKLYQHVGDIPDSLGQSANLFFGFNRLSILDLSAKGHQPMVDASGMVALMMNGEIYNAFDYSAGLAQKGYRFRGKSDTEVVLNLYLEYGIQATLEMLNGMFAIVICDLRNNQLFLARDQFGIKPLYLYEDSQYLAFSSEIKSFQYLPGVRFSLNDSLIDEFLLFRGNKQNTLIKNVCNLEPGTLLSIDLHSHVRSVVPFKPKPSIAMPPSQTLTETINNATVSQLIADVPVGTQLSGGVDSSLITYFASQSFKSSALQTISITFSDPQFSEEPFIRKVSEKLGVQAHLFMMEPEYYLSQLETATWHLEQPINHPNTIGILLISEQAKKYVTVLLSGEGADELFGGYGRFLDMQRPFGLPMLRYLKKELISGGLHLLKHYRSEAWRAVMATAFGSPVMAEQVFPDFSLSRATHRNLELYESFSGSVFDRQRAYEIKAYLPDLLMRQDKMSMAHSMENRVPFLDNNVAGHALALGGKDLLQRHERAWQGKAPLKCMAASLFGKSFAYRNKQGFGIPIRKFLSGAPFEALWYDRVRPGIQKRGLFQHSTLDKTVNNLANAPSNEIEMLWIMLGFEIWASQYLDGSPHQGTH